MAKCYQPEINSTAIAAKTYRRTALFMRYLCVIYAFASNVLRRGIFPAEVRARVEAEPFPCD